MPRKNRVDPFGDLHSVRHRGTFTGNRGCLVNEQGAIVRHHRGNLWITCVLEFRDWRSPLNAPRHWTPLFFLDDAVALAAGHRPCGLCRRADYNSYRSAVMRSLGRNTRVLAPELNQMLAHERLRRGAGLDRASHRMVRPENIDTLPDGSIILGVDSTPSLVLNGRLMSFSFGGWANPEPRPLNQEVTVLTPPTSVAALKHGFVPTLDESAYR